MSDLNPVFTALGVSASVIAIVYFIDKLVHW